MRISSKYYVACSMGILLFALSLLHTTYYILPVYAADSTPSANIKSKLEELKKEIASKAAKLKGEVDKKLKDKVYVGSIKAKSETTITLATDKGPKIININEDTQFDSEVKGVRTISLEKLKEEDYIAALGDIDDTGVLTARKIVLHLAPPQKKQFLWGQIISISDKLLTLRNNQSKNIAVSYKLGEDFKMNDFVILTGNYNKNEIFEAHFLYVINKGGILKNKNQASPSATLKKK